MKIWGLLFTIAIVIMGGCGENPIVPDPADVVNAAVGL